MVEKLRCGKKIITSNVGTKITEEVPNVFGLKSDIFISIVSE